MIKSSLGWMATSYEKRMNLRTRLFLVCIGYRQCPTNNIRLWRLFPSEEFSSDQDAQPHTLSQHRLSVIMSASKSGENMFIYPYIGQHASSIRAAGIHENYVKRLTFHPYALLFSRSSTVKPISTSMLGKPKQLTSESQISISCEVEGSVPETEVKWTQNNRVFERGTVSVFFFIILWLHAPFAGKWENCSLTNSLMR